MEQALPSVIEIGRSLRSNDDTATLLIFGDDLATGDVRICSNKYRGTVTVKLMFCTQNPAAPILAKSAILVTTRGHYANVLKCLQAYGLFLIPKPEALHHQQRPSSTELTKPKHTE